MCIFGGYSIVITVTGKLTLLLALLVSVLPGLAAAQSAEAFPTVHVDAKTLRVQEKAEYLFVNGRFDRAFFIYRNELAPIGDKYSQYMVGYMYEMGKSVGRDLPKAAAWYRLAAERSTPEFVQEHDRLVAKLDAAERARADRWYSALRTEVGDLAVLMKIVREDYEKLRNRTGSRLSSDSSPIAVIEMRQPAGAGSGDYYTRIEKRIEQRLAYIVKQTRIEITDLDVDTVDLDLVEEAVYAHIKASQ